MKLAVFLLCLAVTITLGTEVWSDYRIVKFDHEKSDGLEIYALGVFQHRLGQPIFFFALLKRDWDRWRFLMT